MRLNKLVPHAYFWLIVGLILFSLPAYSQGVDNIGSQLSSLNPQTILMNIQKAIPNLMRLVTAIAYVMGLTFIITGVIKLKHVGEMRTQMSHEHSILTPIVQIAVGALLLYLPSSVQVGMSSFWADPNPYGYITEKDQWQQFINVCFMVVQLIGTIAFIRGLVILSHVGGHGGHQGSLGRGLTHIIGGIFCINIYQFIQVIFATIGINT
jgi:intracellular multiplication protein IcmC